MLIKNIHMQTNFKFEYKYRGHHSNTPSQNSKSGNVKKVSD